MSIFIKGIEMPKERESFQITIKYNGLVFDTETGIQIAEAHEVPDHGRLGDLDAIVAEIQDRIDNIPYSSLSKYREANYDVERGLEQAKWVVVDAPTVIPADYTSKEDTE